MGHRDRFPFNLSHSARFTKTVELINPQPGQSILDYGCGDGHLLDLLASSGATLCGYDPASTPSYIRNTSDLIECSFDAISLCEVLEHVTSKQIDAILHDCIRLLKPSGKLVVSVPVEVGPTSLLKNIVRLVRVRPLETNMTMLNTLRSACYVRIDRLDYGEGYFGHMGFDYRRIKGYLVKQGFSIERITFSPMPVLKGLLNSQVFFVCRPFAG